MALSDRKLAELGQEYDALGDRINKLKGKREIIAGKVIAEMERRGTKALEANGIRVSVAQNSTVRYNLDKLRRLLSKKQLTAITTEVVDKEKLAQAVQDSVVELKDIEKASEVSWASPYIRIGRSR